MSRLALYLLGPPQIERDGEPTTIARRKAVALLAYLAVTGARHSRDALATLLWPDYDQTRARGALRRTLSKLKRALAAAGGGWLAADRESVGLAADADVWLDVDQFRNSLATCQMHGHPETEVCADCLLALAEAAELYRGDFLAGFSLPDSPDFDEWQFFQTESVRRELAGALERLVRGHSDRGEFEPAIGYARRWLALDPLHEPAHRQLMQLYARAGERAAALRQYEECVRVLAAELGVPPADETVELYEALKARRASPEPVRPPTRSPAEVARPVPRHNLPAELTPFLGREAELAEIARLLQTPDCRLLTLSGSGGMGKTRLALRAAADQLAAFQHGVYLVQLAPISSVENLVPAIADTLSPSLYGGADPKEQLLNYLREKQILLLLDNFEHLVEGAGAVSDILTTAPAVKVLITSRERLGLQAEWTLDLQGLSFPDRETHADLADYAAAELFLQSARRAQPGFRPDEEEQTSIFRICRLVEGMPLGLELAAAWVKTISCREIAVEIERGLDILEAELRDVPRRQRSIRAVLAHSWNLTADAERSVFKKLSVFRGGFTRAAAEQVAGASLQSLSALLNKSLLRRSASGRYEIHELLRQYAAERLAADPQETLETRARHAAYFADFVHAREGPLRSGYRKGPIDEIKVEIDNVRVAFRWVIERGDVTRIRQFQLSLFYFYETLGWYREGEAAFRPAVAALERAGARGGEWSNREQIVFAATMTTHGWFIWRLGRPEEAETILRESVSIIRNTGAVWEGWMNQAALANILYDLGKYAEARKLFEANLSQLRDLGYDWPWMEGQSLTGVGRIAYTLGDYRTARNLLQEGLALLRTTGDHLGVMLYLHNLGSVTRALGGGVEAERIYQESLALSREHGYPLGAALSLNDLGNLAHQEGAYERAQEHFQESLRIYKEIGDRRGRALALNSLGLIAAALGDYAEARRLYRAGLAIFDESGNRRGTALTLNNLSVVHRLEQDYPQAWQLCQQSLAMCRELRYPKGIALSRLACGDVAVDQEDYPQAQRLFEESLETCEGIGFQAGIARSRGGLGTVASALGNHDSARQFFHQALVTAAEIQSTPTILEILVGLAALLRAAGDKQQALELVTLTQNHAASDQQTQTAAARLRSDLEAELSPQEIATSQERGSALSLEAVLAAALGQ